MKLRKMLICLIVCTFCIGMPFASKAANGDNLVLNSGFESGSLGYLSNWSLPGTASINKDTNYVRTEKTSLKISTTSYNYPHVQQTWTTALMGGAEYTASMWVYALNTNTSLHFRIYCIDKNGTYIGDIWGEDRYNAAPGKWEEFKSSFRIPKGTVKVIFCLRMGGTGTVYVDDVSCVFTEGPDVFYTYASDGTFYYSNRTEPGKMTARMDTEAYPVLVGKTVRFAFSDGEVVLKEENVTIPESGNVSFSFPMSLLSEKQKPYTVSCTYSEEGADSSVKSHTVYKFDRPTHIDDKGFFRDENGKIFSPHFMYGVGLDDLDMLKNAGINCIQGYPSQEWLDALHQRGMKCLVVLYGGGHMAGSDARIGTATAYVNTYKNHPAVLGWLIHDEPTPQEKDLGELVTAYTRIRAVDPDHPIIITALANYDVLHQYTDVIIQDSYPYNEARFVTYPYERNKKAVEESDGRPVYYLMQTFEHQNSFPKPNEITNMLYASFSAGVKGIGYYRLRGATVDGKNLNETNLWNPIVNFGTKEWNTALDLYPLAKYGDYETLETDSSHVDIFREDEDYVAMVRTKLYDKENEITIPIEGVHNGWQISTDYGTPVSVRTRSGEVLVKLRAGDAARIRISPRESSLFEVGTNGKFAITASSGGNANFSVETDGTLRLTKADGAQNPRIAYTFREGFAPVAGKNYVLKFRYKPSDEGSPIVHFGKNNPYQERYAVFGGDAFTTMPLSDGWTEYAAYFTIPEIDETQNITFMLASYGGSGDGWYDGFALYEDSPYLTVTDTDGKPINEIKGGMTVQIKEHVIAKEAIPGDGKKFFAVGFYTEKNNVKELWTGKMALREFGYQRAARNASGDIVFYTSACDISFMCEIPETKEDIETKFFAWSNMQDIESFLSERKDDTK